MTKSPFQNKTVFVTGAASGIGYETCLKFAKNGADIVAADLNAEGLAAIKVAVNQLGRECSTYALNVTDDQAYVRVAEDLYQTGRLPHVLVNNAGTGFLGEFMEHSTDLWRRILDINVMGVVNGCRAFLPYMKSAGDERHIVNVASLASVAPLPNMSAYAASKHAVHGMSDVLAMELNGTNVSVTSVHPGFVNTPIVHTPGAMGTSFSEERTQKLQAHYAAHGASPEGVAKDIVDAVTHKASYKFTGPGSKLTPLLKRLLSTNTYRKLLINNARQVGYL